MSVVFMCVKNPCACQRAGTDIFPLTHSAHHSYAHDPPPPPSLDTLDSQARLSRLTNVRPTSNVYRVLYDQTVKGVSHHQCLHRPQMCTGYSMIKQSKALCLTTNVCTSV